MAIAAQSENDGSKSMLPENNGIVSLRAYISHYHDGSSLSCLVARFGVLLFLVREICCALTTTRAHFRIFDVVVNFELVPVSRLQTHARLSLYIAAAREMHECDKS
jgi:hypothetical protein